ncbi:unnamed protein product [Didymodactylos carnosus]|uniref:Uncharacterized protein n=1 Tax=Didymodactylos carnosus TaxID=1234261 RepID=A0A8S2NE86_9BILA|nr:unnamed protein product [Didymodactylos carnosus]
MTLVKSPERKQIENFLGVLFNVLFTITGSSFSWFTLTGHIFRKELKRLISKCLSINYANNVVEVFGTNKRPGEERQLKLQTMRH